MGSRARLPENLSTSAALGPRATHCRPGWPMLSHDTSESSLPERSGDVGRSTSGARLAFCTPNPAWATSTSDSRTTPLIVAITSRTPTVEPTTRPMRRGTWRPIHCAIQWTARRRRRAIPRSRTAEAIPTTSTLTGKSTSSTGSIPKMARKLFCQSTRLTSAQMRTSSRNTQDTHRTTGLRGGESSGSPGTATAHWPRFPRHSRTRPRCPSEVPDARDRAATVTGSSRGRRTALRRPDRHS